MGPFVFSNLFVALCAAALTVETYVLFGAAPHRAVAVLVFFATLAVYNFDRLIGESAEDRVEETPRHLWIREHARPLWAVAATGLLGAAAMLLWVPWRIFLGLIPLALVSAAYSLPILGRRLKEVPGSKTFVIGVVWAAVTAGLPALDLRLPLWDGALHVFERFIFIFAITLPFEVRDLRRDAASEILTLPHLLGVRRTQFLAAMLLLLFGALGLVHYVSESPGAAVALMVSAVTTMALVAMLHEARGDFYYSVLMDGTMIAQLVFVFVLSGTM